LIAIRAKKLFDGRVDQPLSHQTVIVRAGLIDGIVAGDPSLPKDTLTLDTPILSPGLIDLQINGAKDVLFNDAPTVETLSAMASAARQGGAAHVLPTFITAGGVDYRQALDAVSNARAQDIPGILGVHLEGPFLSPKRPGIHDASAIRPIEADDLNHLKEGLSGRCPPDHARPRRAARRPDRALG